MKKSIIILMTALLLCACLLSCEKTDGKVTEPVDPEQLSAPFSIIDGGMTFRVDISEDRLNFYENGVYDTVYQTFQHMGVADLAVSKSGVIFEDVNFDGFKDVLLPQRSLDGVQYYYGYIWKEEEKQFVFDPDILNIGNPVINENSISGTVVEHGKAHEAEFFYEDGSFVTEHIHHDAYADVALEYMQGFLGKEEIECQFTAWELVDRAICKKYFVMENGEAVGACAVNGDGQRVFYSPLTESYTEILSEGDSFSQGTESYGRMDYSGEVFTYVAEGFESLDDSGKEIYGAAYNELMSFREVEYSKDGEKAALKAVFSDHPELYNFYRIEEKNTSLKAYLYCKWAPYKTPEASELTEAIEQYEAFTDEIINSIPVGLEPLEKYLFLAQRLELMSKGHEGESLMLELYISGDSNGDKIARTYKYLCEKAQLYCTYEGAINTLLIDGEKVEVDAESAFRHVPGSEKWFEAFFMEQE